MSTICCDLLRAGGIGEPLPSVWHNGQRYIVAEAGVEFTVRVKLHNVICQDHKVFLSIDGQDVGFAKVLHAQYEHSEAIFEGYLQQQATNNGPSLYRTFKFGSCKPAEDAATVEHPDEIQAGRIDIRCDLVIATGHTDSAQTPAAPVPLDDKASKKKLPEGKKWFLAPGLKAEAGKTVASDAQWSQTVYTSVLSLPSLKIRYDTMENLLLRKILDVKKPMHRAILRTSSNSRMVALGQDPVETGSRPAAGGSSTRRVKREGGAAAPAAGIKRERGKEDAVPRSATAETVDLTGQVPAGPLIVRGRVVGADETAVCDLCDSDNEPDWQVQKKQAIDV